MKTRLAWVASIAPIIVAAPLGLAHCSGTDAGSPIIANTGKGSDASVASGDGATATGDDAGATASDAGVGPTDATTGIGPTGDAAPEASSPAPPPIPVPEGGAPSDPGIVPCNGSACDVSQGYVCCVGAGDGGGPVETCNAPNTPCGSGSLTRACNEAADCTDGVCCQDINGIAEPGSTGCKKSCPAGQTFQTCRTDAECGDDAGASASRCIPQTCSNVAPPRTLKIEACAQPSTFGNPNPSGTLAYCTASP